MDKANIDYIMDIFRILSNEVPDQMLYREGGDSIELRTIDDSAGCLAPDALKNGWRLIGSQMAGAA